MNVKRDQIANLGVFIKKQDEQISQDKDQTFFMQSKITDIDSQIAQQNLDHRAARDKIIEENFQLESANRGCAIDIDEDEADLKDKLRLLKEKRRHLAAKKAEHEAM